MLPAIKLISVSILEKYQRSITFMDFGNKAFLRLQIKFESVSQVKFQERESGRTAFHQDYSYTSMWSGLCTLFFLLLFGGSFKIMVSVLY